MGSKLALLCSAVLAGASVIGVGAARAADAAAASAGPSTTALEEIVVTARKREESLQSVPVAVTSQSGEQLARQRVTEPKDLGRITPSLRIVSAAGSDNSAVIALRGQIAGDSLLGISQPVGLYEDNVNIPHPLGANNAFVDIARVEVLKGPQGTLYGRNTTGGAINIITKGADYSGVHGFAEGELGNFASRRIVAAVNLPIVPDVLAVRVAGQYWKKDGFGKSLVTGQRFGDDHDDALFRASVKFDPTPDLTASLKLEYGEAHHTFEMLANRSIASGQSQFLDYASAMLWQDFAGNVQTVGAALAGNAAAAGQVFAKGGAILAPCIGGSIYVNCSATHNFDDLQTWHGALDVNWDITDAIRLRSITGYHRFTNSRVFDLDGMQPQILEVGYGVGGLIYAPTSLGGFTPPFRLVPDQASSQWSQEFNLVGNLLDNRLNWLLGAYGSWDRGHGAQLAGALSEITGLGGSPLSFAHYGVNNDNDTWGVFTQEDFKLTDQLSVTAGLRYTEEKLRQDLADVSYNFLTKAYTCNGLTATGAITTGPPPIANDPTSCAFSAIAQGPGGIYSHRKSSGTSYLLSLNYQVTPDQLLYAKTSRGFRGGAFGRAVQIPAAPEIATDYELGFKGDWFGRRLRTNLAAYQTDYKNKQVSSLVCNGGELPPCATGFTTHLLNAATARIRGFEGEFQAVPIEGLELHGTLSYTDAKYRRFPGAVSDDGVPIGNADGEDLAATPKWQGSLGARYERPVWSGVLALQLDYSYRGKIAVTPLNNQSVVPDDLERQMKGSVGLLNGRIEFREPDSGLTVSVWGANLTDKQWGYEGISANYTGGVSHMVVESPRTYGVTIRKTFGAE